MGKRQKDEFLFFLSTRKKIIALAKIIAKGNRDYCLEGDDLRTQTRDRLVCVLNSEKSWIKNELSSHGIVENKNNVTLAREAIKKWKKLPQSTREWLPQNVCSLNVCYQT